MSFGSYLLGCLGLGLGLAFLAAIATVARRCLLAGWAGPVAWVATAALAAAAAILPALLLGSFGLLTGWSWLLAVAVAAAAAGRWGDRLPRLPAGPAPAGPGTSPALNAAGLAIAAAVVGCFVAGVALKLGTGMTGFDTTWYHGPFAAGFAQSGDTFSLHLLAPQFLSWFYPQNSELMHGLGILAFGNDFLSPLINLAWLGGCLTAAWCVGRPYGAAPLSLAGVALVLGSVAMSDQAGEARNDIVGTFFVLAGLAVLINAACGGRRIGLGPVIVIALAAGLAAGTKVNFIPAGLALAAGAVWLSEPRLRRRALLAGGGAALLGGGYWYLRNLVHSGNPLPWIDHLGPLSLPGPDQDVGGRDAGSVWGYLGDLDVIRDWFVPGLGDGFGSGWPVLILLVAAGLALCLGRGSGPARRTGAVVGLALIFAWLVAPTSASGPAGAPAGFVSGLRYLAPALAVGMALVGSGFGPRGAGARWLAMGALLLLAPFTIAAGDGWALRHWLIALAVGAAVWLAALLAVAAWRPMLAPGWARASRGFGLAALAVALPLLVLAGQPVQRHYFEHRYAAPEFTTPGLGATFAWARDVDDARIGTTATRQYPLFGLTLGNRVQFIGEERPHAGFVRPESCAAFRRAVDRGGYDYLVLALDRESPKRDLPREHAWVAGDPNLTPVLEAPGASVLAVDGPLGPGCG